MTMSTRDHRKKTLKNETLTTLVIAEGKQQETMALLMASLQNVGVSILM
jgi:hypothetical protein